MKRIDMVGQVFGRLTVVSYFGVDANKQALWLCRCACGAERAVQGGKLRGGQRSCGCAASGLHPERSIHGAAMGGRVSPEYATWRSMISRCENPQNKSFKDYGGRGIAVCARWRASFQDFLADVGLRPSPRHSIDRMNNHRGYEPGNCQWATREHQARNKRTNVRVTVDGRTMTTAEWARANGLSPSTVCLRLKAGWNPARAVTEPVGPTSRRVRRPPADHDPNDGDEDDTAEDA